MSDQPPPPSPPANPYGAVPYGGQPGMPGTLPWVEARYGRVADFGSRVVAYLVDTLVALAPLVLTVIGFVVIGVSSSGSLDSPALTVVGILLAVGGYVGSIALSIWNRVFRAGRTGQSIGKQAQGLVLVDAVTGRPIGTGNAFLRELVNGVANSVLWLGSLWMLWDPDKQTLGDKAVHSTVIHVSRT
jgi:uncharacterized RDD family membrane protein YckC